MLLISSTAMALVLPLLAAAASDAPPTWAGAPASDAAPQATSSTDPQAPELTPPETRVITPGRQEEPLHRALRPTEQISALDLTRRAIATTPDALEEATGVAVQRSNLGGGSPFIRGVTGQRVLLMQDGVRLNDGTFRPGPNPYLAAIDPFLIDTVEVLRGPASVLYGSDAIGGVVNVRLKTPTLSAEGRCLGAAGILQLASPTREKSGQLRLSAALPGAAIFASATYTDFDDLEVPDGRVPTTGYQTSSFSLFGLAVAGPGIAQLRLTKNNQINVPRTDRCPSAAELALPTSERPPFDCRTRDEQFKDQLVIEWTGAVGPLDLLSARTYLRRTHELRLRRRDAKARTEQELDEVVTPGLLLDAEMNTLGGLPLSLHVGLDASEDRVRSSAEHHLDDGTVKPLARGRFADGARSFNAAAFALLRYRYPALLEVWAGGRVQKIRNQVQDPTFGDVTIAPLAFVGAAGVHLFPESPVAVLLDVSQGFRAPNLDDLSALGEFGGGFDVPSPTLTPERATSFEATVRIRAGRVRAEAAGFATLINDAIVRAEGTYQGAATLEVDGEALQVFQRVNTGRARLYGFEARAEVDLSHGLSLRGQASFAHGDDLTNNTPLSRVTPALGLIALRYQRPQTGPEIELSLRLAGAQRRLAPRDLGDRRICPDAPDDCTGTDGYAVLAVRVGLPLSEKVRADLNLMNLGNTRYRVHGSGIDGPGLGAALRLTWAY